jgi:hypothetical protein
MSNAASDMTKDPALGELKAVKTHSRGENTTVTYYYGKDAPKSLIEY